MCDDEPIRKIVPKKPDFIRDLQQAGDDALDSVQEALDTEVQGLTESLKTEVEGLTESVKTEVEGAGKTLGMNTEQDLMPKIDVDIQDLSKIMPNLNQDFTRISLPGLAAEVPKIGSAIQQGAINAGSALQQNLIAAGSAMQQNAIDFGRNISGGQSNPTLEGIANSITKEAEGEISTLVNSLETNAEGITQTTEDLVSSNVAGIEALPEDIAEFNVNAVKGLQLLLSQFDPAGGGGGQATTGDNLAPAPTIGDPDELPMEQATSKAGQMTEEERLRRMRRLLLNRYGREDTILSGGGDTMSRRRYAL